MTIHPSAIVSKNAVIGVGATVGAYSIIEDDVEIGKNCSIAAHAIVRRGSVLHDEVRVDSFAVIGGEPQSLNFDLSIKSGVIIESGSVIREGCTIHRASSEGANTIIGEKCFLMAQVHVAHDCELANEVVLTNNVMLAGHVTVGAKTYIGGGAGIHQFCRIGSYAMVAGNASITADVPPYMMVSERNQAHGLNLVGLRRGGFDRSEILDLKQCYRALYLDDGGNLKKKANELLAGAKFGTTEAGKSFLGFFQDGKRGFAHSVKTAD